MAKWYGKLGFAYSSETKPGIFTDVKEEVSYYGDLLKGTRASRQSRGESIKDLVITNTLSIVCDDFLMTNLKSIKYVTLYDQNIEVTAAEYEYPRIVLTLGGEYNG